MNEYEMQVLIEELQKLVVDKELKNKHKDFEIDRLKKEVERLEELLTPKASKD